MHCLNEGRCTKQFMRILSLIFAWGKNCFPAFLGENRLFFFFSETVHTLFISFCSDVCAEGDS